MIIEEHQFLVYCDVCSDGEVFLIRKWSRKVSTKLKEDGWIVKRDVQICPQCKEDYEKENL